MLRYAVPYHISFLCCSLWWSSRTTCIMKRRIWCRRGRKSWSHHLEARYNKVLSTTTKIEPDIRAKNVWTFPYKLHQDQTVIEGLAEFHLNFWLVAMAGVLLGISKASCLLGWSQDAPGVIKPRRDDHKTTLVCTTPVRQTLVNMQFLWFPRNLCNTLIELMASDDYLKLEV